MRDDIFVVLEDPVCARYAVRALLPVSLAREMENNALMRVRVLVEW